MVSPSTTVTLPTRRSFPSLGVLLAMSGVLLVFIGRTETPIGRVPPLEAKAQTPAEGRRSSISVARSTGRRAGAMSRCNSPAAEAIDCQKVAWMGCRSRAVAPTPRHARWPEAGVAERYGPDELGAVRPRSGEANYLETALPRGTRPESAHVGTSWNWPPRGAVTGHGAAHVERTRWHDVDNGPRKSAPASLPRLRSGNPPRPAARGRIWNI